MTSLAFGPFGITSGLTSAPHSLEAAAAAEDLGYPAIWLSGGPLPGLQTITDLIEATRTIKFVSGILSVDSYPAADVTAAYQALEAAHPGRFTVGLGGAHGPKPIARLSDYFDQLDAAPAGQTAAAPAGQAPGVPLDHRLLAALGPRMLELARERTSGAYPFLITPAYSAEARKVLGEDKLLAVSHLVVLKTDPDEARAIARNTLSFFTGIPSYAASLRRQGFSDAEQHELPDHMVDSLAAWGTPDAIATKLREHHAHAAPTTSRST